MDDLGGRITEIATTFKGEISGQNAERFFDDYSIKYG